MELSLGKRISYHRKRLKMTQDQLADKLGITAQAVSKWENDQCCPDISILPQLADIFGITTDELLGRTSDSTVHIAEVVDKQEDDGIHIQKGNWEFTWECGRRDALAFPIGVLIIGILYLISHFLNWGLSLWEICWPTTILLFGIWGLLKHFAFFPLGCILFGGYALANKIFVFQFDLTGKLLWAILIIAFGISLLADALKKPKKPKLKVSMPPDKKIGDKYISEENHFTFSGGFGEHTQIVEIESLQGGTIAVSFGDYCIDLTSVQSVTNDCEIEANCNFGELEIIVPKRFRCVTEHAASFGNLDVTGAPSSTPEGQIKLTGSVNFGEIEIRYV